MKIKTTYDVGQSLFVYTKQGLSQKPVISIHVFIDDEKTEECYLFERYGTSYSLAEIVATNQKQALNALKENEKQLQLLLT